MGGSSEPAYEDGAPLRDKDWSKRARLQTLWDVIVNREPKKKGLTDWESHMDCWDRTDFRPAQGLDTDGKANAKAENGMECHSERGCPSEAEPSDDEAC